MPCQKGKSSGSSVVIQSISKQTTNHKPISPLTSGHSLPGAGHCLVQAPGKQPGWAQCNTTESLVIWKRTCTQTPSSPLLFLHERGRKIIPQIQTPQGKNDLWDWFVPFLSKGIVSPVCNPRASILCMLCTDSQASTGSLTGLIQQKVISILHLGKNSTLL